jgi:hypothetical protein
VSFHQPNPSSVIVGFNPTIHAMTVQKHCPQTRFSSRMKSGRTPFAASWHGWPGQPPDQVRELLAILSSVTTGLEPVIHAPMLAMTMQKHCPQTPFSSRRSQDAPRLPRHGMDGRVKPGHDNCVVATELLLDQRLHRAPAGSSFTPPSPPYVSLNLSSVIVGFNPTIHAMTAQKHRPQTRPAFLAASPRG